MIMKMTVVTAVLMAVSVVMMTIQTIMDEIVDDVAYDVVVAEDDEGMASGNGGGGGETEYGGDNNANELRVKMNGMLYLMATMIIMINASTMVMRKVIVFMMITIVIIMPRFGQRNGTQSSPLLKLCAHGKSTETPKNANYMLGRPTTRCKVPPGKGTNSQAK